MPADESRHFRRRLNQVEYIVRNVASFVAFDLHQNIARVKHTRGFDSLVTTHLDDSFRWHEHFRNLTLQIGIADAGLQAVANLFLMTRVRM